jgi:hypothetical protein
MAYVCIRHPRQTPEPPYFYTASADLESFPVNSLILKSAQLEALGDRITL